MVVSVLLTLASAAAYPKAFIDWNVPVYAVGVALLILTAFFYFLTLFLAKEKSKPVIPALIGAVIYAAAFMGITPLVNNGIFGSVAPWGSVLVNSILNLILYVTVLILINKATAKAMMKLVIEGLFVVVMCFILCILAIVPNFRATSFVLLDTYENYVKRMDKIEVFENTIETAIPQTDIHDIIKNHFEAPLPEGKTEKKAIVLGWDGARADAFEQFYGEAIADRLLSAGGTAEIAYCGGARYPEKIIQDTSTAPGWCTILTGVWADKHGVEGNSPEKTLDYPSLLISLPESGLADSSAFYFSWDGHLTTYKQEIEYVKANNLDVDFVYNEDGDDGTYNTALADISSPDCSDFIFTILEYCDKWGHEYGFWNETPEYQDAVRLSAQKGLELMDAIKSRPTFETEDWLVVITSDHGGYVRGHGGETIMERMMFVIYGTQF